MNSKYWWRDERKESEEIAPGALKHVFFISVSITLLFINKNFAFGNVFVLTHLRALEIDSSPELKARLSHSAIIQEAHFQSQSVGVVTVLNHAATNPQTDWSLGGKGSWIITWHWPPRPSLCPSWGWRWLIEEMSSRNCVLNTRSNTFHIYRAAARHFFLFLHAGRQKHAYSPASREEERQEGFVVDFSRIRFSKNTAVLCANPHGASFYSNVNWLQFLLFFSPIFPIRCLLQTHIIVKFLVGIHEFNENRRSSHVLHTVYLPKSDDNLGKMFQMKLYFPTADAHYC